MQTKAIECPKCGKIGGELIGSGEFSLRALCDTCQAEKEILATEEGQRERQIKRDAFWRKLCPETYQHTDMAHKGLNPNFLIAARAWKPQGKGLGFVGPAGTGKTRLLFYCLKKALDAGHSIFAINHSYFCKYNALAAQSDARNEVQQRKQDMARSVLADCKSKKYLLFDDIGKARTTESANEALMLLLEDRTSRNLPTLWSANGGGEWLIERLGEDRGKAIVRRLAEFGEVVKL